MVMTVCFTSTRPLIPAALCVFASLGHCRCVMKPYSLQIEPFDVEMHLNRLVNDSVSNVCETNRTMRRASVTRLAIPFIQDRNDTLFHHTGQLATLHALEREARQVFRHRHTPLWVTQEIGGHARRTWRRVEAYR